MIVRLEWTVSQVAADLDCARRDRKSINGHPFYLEATRPGSKRTLWRLLRLGRIFQFRVRAIAENGDVSTRDTGPVFELRELANTRRRTDSAPRIDWTRSQRRRGGDPPNTMSMSASGFCDGGRGLGGHFGVCLRRSPVAGCRKSSPGWGCGSPCPQRPKVVSSQRRPTARRGCSAQLRHRSDADVPRARRRFAVRNRR